MVTTMLRWIGLLMLFPLFSCKGNINDDNFPLPLTARASVTTLEIQANGDSDQPAITGDGRFLAFRSDASNLVAADGSPNYSDIFVRDTVLGTTAKVSVVGAVPIFLAPGLPGDAPNGDSFDPAIAADAGALAFASEATNFVGAADTPFADIFYIDKAHAGLKQVSNPTSGATDGPSTRPSISADGDLVAYQSDARDLDGVFPPDTNSTTDIFVWAVKTNKNARVSLSQAGAQSTLPCLNPAISGDGRYVVFETLSTIFAGPGQTDANVFTDIVRVNLSDKSTEIVSVQANGATGSANATCADAHISRDGRYVVFSSDCSTLVPGDTNNARDVFLRDMTAGTTIRVSISTNGLDPDGPSNRPTVTDDGAFVAFESGASNLIGLDTNTEVDIYIRDVANGTNQRGSVRTFGGQAIGGSSSAARITGDGKFLALCSAALNLVDSDTNTVQDIFLRGPLK